MPDPAPDTPRFRPERLPRPFDPEAAARLAERFAERDAAARGFAEAAEGRALLAAIGGHSPFLAELALRDPVALERFAERGPEEALARALDPLGRADPGAAREQVATLLRQAKRQAALIIAAADIAGVWSLEQVTAALSDLAERTLDFACAHLLLAAAERGELKLGRPAGAARTDPRAIGKASGLIVLGMGKLGGRELNYSSDIDLMLLFDSKAAYHEDRAGAVFVRIARDLVRLMEDRTAEGYVFRTDLRLRPDPAATPLAVSLPAAIQYYESMGQNWERAAMIKARPVAADRALGDHFLREIRPFVWRRHLDFAAMADIHSIKRQIHAHKGARGAGGVIALEGHDVKLGRGGIREIEFTAQVLQLIWGGRDPGLRDPTTLGALAALVAAGKLERRAAADLADAYDFLRRLEHRLQMVADRQTHRLPEDAAGMARIASFMGFDSAQSFAQTFLAHLGRVERHYAGLFESAPALSRSEEATADAGGNLVFTGVEDDPGTIATLRRMGFADPSSVAAMVRGWHHGRPRATRSQRARELLTELMPALLAAFGRQHHPDQALARFDAVLTRLPAGVQVLSLLARNPAMLDRIAGILGAAPELANHLARSPAAMDGLLAGTLSVNGADPSAVLPALVKDARHLEEALEAARRIATERRFEIDAAALEGQLDADTAGGLRSDLAESAIGALLPRIVADFAERYGRVPGGALAVVAMGKLGGRELLPGSDLDLVLIYDHDDDATGSEGGRRSLAPSEYFIRLAPQMVSAITAPGGEGRLWEVDMRLRPSGNKGPVAVRLSTFETYHATESWTWERMALTRARAIAGPPALKRRVQEAVRSAILDPRRQAPVLADAGAMRARMLKELPAEGPWDVKAMPGGLVEVEFIAQALQLHHAPTRPEVLATTTRTALERLGKAGLLGAEETTELIQAERLWRTVTGLIRLTHGRSREEALPPPAEAALLRAAAPLLATEGRAAPVDLAQLRAQMRDSAGRVRAAFNRHIANLGGL